MTDYIDWILNAANLPEPLDEAMEWRDSVSFSLRKKIGQEWQKSKQSGDIGVVEQEDPIPNEQNNPLEPQVVSTGARESKRLPLEQALRAGEGFRQNESTGENRKMRQEGARGLEAETASIWNAPIQDKGEAMVPSAGTATNSTVAAPYKKAEIAGTGTDGRAGDAYQAGRSARLSRRSAADGNQDVPLSFARQNVGWLRKSDQIRAAAKYAAGRRETIQIPVPVETGQKTATFDPETFDLTVQRDARRYDGGFEFY